MHQGSAGETRKALRWLLGLVLLAVTCSTGALVVAVVSVSAYPGAPLRLGQAMLRAVAWAYLVAGLLLALWLLLERRGARYLFGAWFAALALLMASVPRLTIAEGVGTAVVVGLLVRALDWATEEHAA